LHNFMSSSSVIREGCSSREQVDFAGSGIEISLFDKTRQRLKPQPRLDTIISSGVKILLIWQKHFRSSTTKGWQT
jgi:hypothetical protein